MPALQTASGPIAYDVQGDGCTIVLLSSGAHDRHDFDELRAMLHPLGYRTIALDWPGHGESPLGEGPASAMRLADVAEEFVKRLVPKGAIIVGNSVGGFSAGRMAIRHPELVKGLVLIDAGGFAGRPLRVRVFCALMSRPWFLRRIYPSFSAHYMRSTTAADRRVRAVGVATTRRDPGLRAVAELWRSFSSPDHDLRDGAGSITSPTLVIWGRQDPVISLRTGREAAESITGARLVELDTGHVPHTSDPETCAAEIDTFARSISAGTPAEVAR